MMKHYQKPWKVLISVCLVRTNSLSRQLSELDLKYSQMKDTLEVRNSVLNDYELSIKTLEEKSSIRKAKMTDAEEQEILLASRELARLKVSSSTSISPELLN